MSLRLLPFLVVALVAGSLPVLSEPGVNVLTNPAFEIGVTPMADALEGTAVDVEKGVGRQLLGCTASASIVWSGGCNGPDDPVNESVALAQDPASEAELWLADGYHSGDLVLVAPAEQSLWHAASWAMFPLDTIDVRDHDGNLEREARILPGNQMLYQSFGSPSAHTALPAGLLTEARLRFESGAPAGLFALVLNGFPLESAAAWPQAFVTYQLFVPASKWTFEDGEATIDPLVGSLAGPYAGAYLPVPPQIADEHPTASQWASGSRDERREILMQLRVTQMTFWNLPPGAVVDDAALDADA